MPHHCPNKHSNSAACKRAGCIKKCLSNSCDNYVNDRNSVNCRSCTRKIEIEEINRKKRNQQNQQIQN